MRILLLSFLFIFNLLPAYAADYTEPLGAYLHRDTDFFEQAQASLAVSIGQSVICEELEALLYQKAELLVTPVLLEADIQCQTEGNSTAVNLSFSAPSAKRITHFIWVISKCQRDQSDCKEISQTEFTVYPNNLFASIQTFSEKNVVQVDDPTGILENLFNKNNIRFMHAMSAPIRSANDTQVLKILVRQGAGKAFEQKVDRALKDGHVLALLINEDLPDKPLLSLPMVYHRQSTSNLVMVSLPILRYLEKSPRAQSIFIELFQRALN